MDINNGIKKILEAYESGNFLRVSQLGKSLFKDIPNHVRKIVEVSNFLTGSLLCGDVEDVIDYTSHLDVILAKVLFLEGNFKSYRNTVYSVLRRASDTLSKLYSLKEIKMFDEKGASDYLMSYNLKPSSEREDYLLNFLRNDYKLSIKIISSMLSKSSNYEIVLDLMDIWHYTGQYRELSELCLQFYREGRISDYFLYLYGYSLFSSGRVHEAINVLEKLMDKYPDNVNISYNLSASYYRMGNFAKSLEIMENAQRLNSSVEINFAKGVILYRLGRYLESKNEFQKSSSVEDFRFSSKYNISICEYRMGNYESAIAKLVELRNEEFVDRRNFETINRTISVVKRSSMKISYYLLFVISAVFSFGIGFLIYFLITNFGLR